mgnify:FL=1
MKRGIVIDPKDNVGLVLEPVNAGETVDFGVCHLKVTEPIKALHKVALCELGLGNAVVKYGQPIGYATAQISKGQWVHVHNLDAEKMMK